MNTSSSRSARVAISACSVEQRFRLEEILERNGWYVIINAPLKTAILSRLNEVRPDALVVDVEHASDHDMEVLRFLLPRCTVPVLVADDEIRQALSSDAELGERLNEKLEAMISQRFAPESFERMTPESAPRVDEERASDELPSEAAATAVAAPVGIEPQTALSGQYAAPEVRVRERGNVIETPYFSVGTTARIEYEPVKMESAPVAPVAAAGRQPGNLWVLGASLGGPQAVARFLAGIPPDLDVAFLLVQRIGPQYVPVLVKQLNSACALEVREAVDGDVLRGGAVIVAPVDRRVAIGADGTLKLLGSAYSADLSALDFAMQAVARRFHGNAGAIVFSGMGDDGIKGCHTVLDHGGTVWTQDTDSCVIDSMPKHVRHACKVEISADPETLAAHLVEKLSVEKYVRAGAAGG